jgi:hypothetical protein
VQIVEETPSSKITRAKWTAGVAQVAEPLFCKCKALSSNPSPTKKKKMVAGLGPHLAKLPAVTCSETHCILF